MILEKSEVETWLDKTELQYASRTSEISNNQLKLVVIPRVDRAPLYRIYDGEDLVYETVVLGDCIALYNGME